MAFKSMSAGKANFNDFKLYFSEQAGRPPCSLDPFFIMPDKCRCVDFQVLKLQELPDFIPQVSNNLEHSFCMQILDPTFAS